MAYVSSPNNADDDVSSSAALLGNEMGIQKDVSKNEVPNKSTSSTNRRYFGYGSTGTMSTYLHSFSSSSPESSTTDSSENNNSNSHNKIHRLGIDLNAIEDSDESSAVISINSTYSDISSDGGGYYNRFARHRQQLLHRSSKYFFLTANNFKVALSLVLWFLCYMIMGVLGGSVAYMHFPRTDADIPKTLPDFGYDIIPVSKVS